MPKRPSRVTSSSNSGAGALAEGHGRSNCETLFGVSTIPSDNYIHLMPGLLTRRLQRYPYKPSMVML